MDGVVEVKPGFDCECSGLVVPWEATTRTGMAFNEVLPGKVSDPEDAIRCVIGPVDSEVDKEKQDWLQFKTNHWEPTAQSQWMPLGKRHWLGAVGGSVELQLNFRDARGHPHGPAQIAEMIHFDKASACRPRNAVFLNVFDLASAVVAPNAMLCNTMIKSVGAYHAAIEVYGEEWSFYRTPTPSSCGVCRSLRPKHHPVHIYRQTVYLGDTSLQDWEVRYLIRGQLAHNWLGGSYSLLTKNCIHFCEELSLCLGCKKIPAWVTGLHETGAALFRLPWPLSLAFESGAQAATPMLTAEADAGRSEGKDPAQVPADGSLVDIAR